MTSKDLFEWNLTRRTIQLENVEETFHSGETGDISSGYERICETIKDYYAGGRGRVIRISEGMEQGTKIKNQQIPRCTETAEGKISQL